MIQTGMKFNNQATLRLVWSFIKASEDTEGVTFDNPVYVKMFKAEYEGLIP